MTWCGRPGGGDSIENTAKLLKNVLSANDIRYHLNKINNFEELETQINQALKSRIPLGLEKGCLKIAIDLNLICYYGKPTLEELPYIYRSQTKSGCVSTKLLDSGQGNTITLPSSAIALVSTHKHTLYHPRQGYLL